MQAPLKFIKLTNRTNDHSNQKKICGDWQEREDEASSRTHSWLSQEPDCRNIDCSSNTQNCDQYADSLMRLGIRPDANVAHTLQNVMYTLLIVKRNFTYASRPRQARGVSKRNWRFWSRAVPSARVPNEATYMNVDTRVQPHVDGLGQGRSERLRVGKNLVIDVRVQIEWILVE